MKQGRFSPRARLELRAAAEWIAEDNEAAAVALLQAAIDSADLVATRPGVGQARPELATDRFRFLPLRGFPYILVYDLSQAPPVVTRLVHQARDLPIALADLEG